MEELAYCKGCQRSATKREALTMLRCPRCGGTDYIVPGIRADGLCQYYVNRGAWAKAKAALLASDLEPWELNERHGDLMTMQECAAWVEREELMALDAAHLREAIGERYGQTVADWYCDEYLGGYDQRWQTSASARASGKTG